MAVNSLRSRGRPAWRAHTCSVAKGLPHRETDDDQARCAAERERWHRDACWYQGDQRGERDQGSNPDTAHLNNACPVTNGPVPPSVSATEVSVSCTPGCATMSSSAAT